MELLPNHNLTKFRFASSSQVWRHVRQQWLGNLFGILRNFHGITAGMCIIWVNCIQYFHHLLTGLQFSILFNNLFRPTVVGNFRLASFGLAYSFLFNPKITNLRFSRFVGFIHRTRKKLDVAAWLDFGQF